MQTSSVESLAFIETYRSLVDQVIDQAIQHYSITDLQLSEAMRYSSLLGGKRIRPALVLATSKALGGSIENSIDFACALEFIHAYSLIHDDLPAMDDDNLRRGQPTCHIAFDEATAILAGDALQALAFEICTKPNPVISSQQQLDIIRTLAKASGARGMVAGQAIDLSSVGLQTSLEHLEAMHKLKTGALIQASVVIGALSQGHVEADCLDRLKDYAEAIGLGFQVQDDILDVVSDTETLGKTQGADQALNKPTYPSLLGLDGAKTKLHELHQRAHQALAELKHCDTSELAAIADYIVARTH